MTIAKHHIRAIECEIDGIYFNRYFFKQRFGAKMEIGRHHECMQCALDRTLLSPNDPNFISRLIITMPPGYTKTEMAVINYMARGLAINPQSRFLHLSYSHKLALQNSTTARSIVKSSTYQQMWQVGVKYDVDSKEIWHTENNGGVTATSAGGQVTGFRAGHMDPTKFTGALIIDDPVKPDHAYSEIMREGVNNNYNETIASRLAIETVPTILVMQRIHYRDLAGYLLTGGSGEMWHHLDLPVIIDNNQSYPAEYTHGIPIDHGLSDGWLWPFKHNETHYQALKSHRRRFWSQYMQRPIKRDEERALWPESAISKARAIDFGLEPEKILVSIDPAVTNDETSDEHGIGVCCKYSTDKYGVLADMTRRGSPAEWAETAIAAYDEFNADAIVIEINQGGDMCEGTLRAAGFKGKLLKVRATKGKVLRAEPIAALYELGYVSHKSELMTNKMGREFNLVKLEDEMMDLDSLTGKANGRSPNRVDWLVWGLTELSNKKPKGILDVI